MATIINKTLFSQSREEIREEVTNWFLVEKPGTGNGQSASRYRYNVESVNSTSIFLLRPARLNKGFDFTVNVEGHNFGNGRGSCRTMPSHKNIIDDLKIKKNEDNAEYSKLLTIIDKIYNCCNVDDLEYDDILLKNGLPVELLCKIIKWLFIEQDITYWNYSGRSMLNKGIPR